MKLKQCCNVLISKGIIKSGTTDWIALASALNLTYNCTGHAITAVQEFVKGLSAGGASEIKVTTELPNVRKKKRNKGKLKPLKVKEPKPVNLRNIKSLKDAILYIGKGMTKDDCDYAASPNFTNGALWKQCRLLALNKYYPICMKCGNDQFICVDHIKPRKLNPELCLSVSNLQLLCGGCNKDKGNKNSIDYRQPEHELPDTSADLEIVRQMRKFL